MTLRRFLVVVAAVALSAAGVFAAYQMHQPQGPALAELMPEGALLYLECPDFHSLLADWEGSAEKRSWLASDDYAVFSRSRLFGRLAQAQTEFATAAGFPSNMRVIDQIAGKQSALGWYDIGKLEFLYITRLPSSNFEQSALWQARGKFEQRQSGDATFYVRTDPESKRTVAFAAKGDWVILGTREDLVASVLALLDGAREQTLATEPWYVDLVHAAKAPGELRMALNLEKIVPSPYFRSYWIQQNVASMKQYRAAISDLYREGKTYREERVLLRRADTGNEAAGVSDVAALAAAVPVDAGFYKAWAAPTPVQAAALLREKLLDPRPAAFADNQYAPVIAPVGENAGRASDLDERIDQAPATAASDAWARLAPTLATATVSGALVVESAYAQHGDVFSGVHSAVVLSSAHGWDADAMRKVIAGGINAQGGTSHLGASWTRDGDLWKLDGLLPLYFSVRGNDLALANDAGLLREIAAKLGKASMADTSETYAAGVNHAQEAAVFAHTSTLIDRANMRGAQDGEAAAGQTPAFFSGNVASLSRMFSGVASESIVERNAGNNVTQTVTYQWR